MKRYFYLSAGNFSESFKKSLKKIDIKTKPITWMGFAY
jgi:hypothetical protein